MLVNNERIRRQEKLVRDIHDAILRDGVALPWSGETITCFPPMYRMTYRVTFREAEGSVVVARATAALKAAGLEVTEPLTHDFVEVDDLARAMVLEKAVSILVQEAPKAV